jgi:hypothetical protein
MTKTEATRIAKRAAYLSKRGRQWVLVSPWNDSNPLGAYTESTKVSYVDARSALTATRARIVLRLLGVNDESVHAELDWAAHDYMRADHSLHGLVKYCLTYSAQA